MNRIASAAAAIIIFASLAGCSYLPDSSSGAVDGVKVDDRRSSILITPVSGAGSSLGFLFVPGGLVDPHAYIQPLSRVALQGPGYAVVIVKEPANLAVLNPGAALSLTESVPGVNRWAIGGHSLGGVIASGLVKKNSSLFAGLVLEASYPQESDSLSAMAVKVLSVSGEFDGLATRAKIDATKPFLPASTQYEVIAGGCHGQFGSYGAQDGDGTPTISRDAQQIIAAKFIGDFLGGL
jgi:hypothetical protein